MARPTRILLFLLAAIVIVAAILVAYYHIWNTAVISMRNTASNQSTIYKVYLAQSPWELERGLMYYRFPCNIPGSCINGMLFIFSNNSQQCFWMKNTPEPLMQLWLDEDGIVTYIYNATPESADVVCHYGKAVLELNKNILGEVSVGDVLSGGLPS